MKRLIQRLKRILQYCHIWLKRLEQHHSQEKQTESQKITMAICRKMISDEDSVLLIAPLSNKKYVKNEKLNIFITIDDNEVSIINHVYNYIVKLNVRDNTRVNYIFDAETELRSRQYENEINKQVEFSLCKILEKIDTL